MKKTLQDQYLLIKEGKGHKDVFIKEAKQQFPGLIRNSATYTEVANVLKTKNLISENVVGLEPINQLTPTEKQPYEVAFENFLAEAKKKKMEDEKAELKKPSKQVEEDAEKNFDYSDKTNPDNLIFDQIMKGYYTEMKDPKNEDKTVEELKAIVFKNLEKNPTYYTEKGQFGVKDLGYTMDLPGLGEPKEPKGKFKSSGYGDLNEEKKIPIPYTGQARPTTPEEDEEFAQEVEREENEEDALRGGRLELDEEGNEGQDIRLTLTGDEATKVDFFEKHSRFFDGPNVYDYLIIPHGEKYITCKQNKLKSCEAYLKKNNIEYKIQESVNEEGKLREAIRSIINEELEEGYDDGEMGTYQRTNTRHGGNPQDMGTYLNAIKGMNKVEAIEYLGEEGLSSSMVMRVISKFDRMGGFEVQDMFDINPRVRGDVFEIRKVIRESIEKELAQINKEAEYEVLDSKLEKITDLIDRRKSRLAKLDEDEDIKALTDKKKVKQFEKEIKTLEKAKFKIEKVLAKKAKSAPKTKAIIDEDEPLDEVASEDSATTADNMERVTKATQDAANAAKELDDVLEEDEDLEVVSGCCSASISGEIDGEYGRCSDCGEMADVIKL